MGGKNSKSPWSHKLYLFIISVTFSVCFLFKKRKLILPWFCSLSIPVPVWVNRFHRLLVWNLDGSKVGVQTKITFGFLVSVPFLIQPSGSNPLSKTESKPKEYMFSFKSALGMQAIKNSVWTELTTEILSFGHQSPVEYTGSHKQTNKQIYIPYIII